MTVPRQGLALAAVLTLLFAAPAAASSPDAHTAVGYAHVKKKPHKTGKGKKPKVRAPRKDPDADGLNNRYERKARTNPRLADSDGNGRPDPAEDRDADGVDNLTEQRALTRPARADSDRDGTPDGAEDPDLDGLNNGGESVTGMHPRKPDSDADGVRDGDEHAGVVQSVTGDVVTILLAGGGELSGRVREDSDIFCAADDGFGDAEDWGAGEDDEPAGSDDEDAEDDDSAADEDEDAGDDDEDFPVDEDDDGEFRRSAAVRTSAFTICVKPGAVVFQADVATVGGVVYFSAIDLLGG